MNAGNLPPPGTASPHQERLMAFCAAQGRPAPRYQVVSDRRGGRTAWSATVEVSTVTYHAQFWYDGQFVNNAKEDAAEKALIRLGVYPQPVRPGGQQGNFNWN